MLADEFAEQGAKPASTRCDAPPKQDIMLGLSRSDLALAALAALALILIERGHTRDIVAPEARAAPVMSCQEDLENRRIVARRMMIADGSIALGNGWRSDTQATCP